MRLPHATTRSILPVAGLIAVLIAMLALGSRSARAEEVDSDFQYNGSGAQTNVIFDELSDYITGEVDFEVVEPDLIPGALQFRAALSTTTTVTIKPPTHFHLSAPAAGVVEGEIVPVTTTQTPFDGPNNEFKLEFGAQALVAVDWDVDEDGTHCANFPDTDPDDDTGGDDDVCIVLDPSKTITVFDESMVAPYAGEQRSFHDEKEIYELKICSLVIGLDVCSIKLIGDVQAKLSAETGGGVTTAGLHAQRDILIGATAGPAGLIAWPDNSQLVDNVQIACNGSPGSSVSYRLKDVSHDSRLTEASAGFHVDISFYVNIDPFGDLETSFTVLDLSDLFNLIDGGPIDVLAGANDFQHVLGNYVAEQKPPEVTLNTPNPASGQEGVPVNFTATAVDNCSTMDEMSFTWDFSDGGIGFGPSIFHTFNDNSTYSYRVTVCDKRGNCAVADPNYVVVNQAPIANAGPDAAEAWGIGVPMNGQAVDPGSGDQSTLSYEWDFGDNTPKGHALNVVHAYTTPGTYTATLKVCDKDGACDTDDREVVVRKRNTSTGYLGAHTWTHDTQIFLSASLVDEFGNAVNARTIDFTIDAAAAASGNTNSLGIADRSYQVSQGAGAHTVLAAFAGDSLYEASSSNDAAVVVVKATLVTYTGSLTGGPNKTITLSAILKDAEGKPLAGKIIVFQLGSQTAQATTDANGLATTTLKLSQKNGSYNLTATFTPAGGDVLKYAASADLETFKLQAK